MSFYNKDQLCHEIFFKIIFHEKLNFQQIVTKTK